MFRLPLIVKLTTATSPLAEVQSDFVGCVEILHFKVTVKPHIIIVTLGAI